MNDGKIKEGKRRKLKKEGKEKSTTSLAWLTTDLSLKSFRTFSFPFPSLASGWLLMCVCVYVRCQMSGGGLKERVLMSALITSPIWMICSGDHISISQHRPLLPAPCSLYECDCGTTNNTLFFVQRPTSLLSPLNPTPLQT